MIRTFEDWRAASLMTAEAVLEASGLDYEPNAYNEYQYSFDPPCHPSGSRRSGQIGTGILGVYINCWLCGPVKATEAMQQYLIDIGCLKRLVPASRGFGGYIQYSVGGQKVRRQMQPTYCGDVLTMAGLLDMPSFIAVEPGSKKGMYVAGIGQMRHSKRNHPTPIAYSREVRDDGGSAGWHTANRLTAAGHNVGLCFGADAVVDAVTDVAIIDVDYKPGKDTQWSGAANRKERFVDWMYRNYKCPVYYSSSGNGAHILFRVYVGDDWELGKLYNRQYTDAFATELYLPGARHLVALQLDKPYRATNTGDIIPVIDKKHILNELERA